LKQNGFVGLFWGHVQRRFLSTGHDNLLFGYSDTETRLKHGSRAIEIIGGKLVFRPGINSNSDVAE